MLVSLDERNRVKRENRSENIRMTRVNIKDFGIYTIKKKYRTKNIRENVKIKWKGIYIFKFISLDSGSRVQWCEVSSQTEHSVCCGTSSEPGAREAPSQGSPG